MQQGRKRWIAVRTSSHIIGIAAQGEEYVRMSSVLVAARMTQFTGLGQRLEEPPYDVLHARKQEWLVIYVCSVHQCKSTLSSRRTYKT